MQIAVCITYITGPAKMYELCSEHCESIVIFTENIVNGAESINHVSDIY